MPAVAYDVTTVERAEGQERAHTVVYTSLYDLIAAVNEAIAPGEEDCVVPIVAHILRTGQARFLRDVSVEML